MFVDFGMAEQYDGVCYLRFDDTNPEAEETEYINHIQEIIGWMGWKPWKVRIWFKAALFLVGDCLFLMLKYTILALIAMLAVCR